MIIALCFGAEQSYAFLAQESLLETAFRRNLRTDSVRETMSRSSSFDDLAHVAKVEGQDKGLSLESLASRLTLFRYDMERLAANNPQAYNALMKAWDLRVQASLAMGAASALASAPETCGASLLMFGASLGAGIGLDYVADLVAKYGAKVVANNACNGDPRLKTSYEKTFAYVGALVGQHGIRATVNKYFPQKNSLKSTVKPVNDRAPINAIYAGKMFDMSKLPRDIQQKYPHGVPFTAAGYPDFSRYSIRKVEIKMTGNRDIDFALANKVAGYKSTPKGYTWHHHEDCKSMLLVPSDLHRFVSHTGAIAILKGKK